MEKGFIEHTIDAYAERGLEHIIVTGEIVNAYLESSCKETVDCVRNPKSDRLAYEAYESIEEDIENYNMLIDPMDRIFGNHEELALDNSDFMNAFSYLNGVRDGLTLALMTIEAKGVQQYV